MKYSRILNAIYAEPWAILPAKLEEIVGVVEARAAGITLSATELKHFAARRKKYTGVNGSVAVIPVYGTIAQRFGLLTASGGTSLQEFAQKYDQAINDPAIGAVLADFDTPGGSVYGVEEMAQKIFDNRGKKPQIAIANAMAASAGFWLASAFDELVVTPSGEVGSVGVIMMHEDFSKANEAEGRTVTYVTAGKYKAEGNPDEPLGDEARAEYQGQVDRYYTSFVDSLARNRGVTSRTVKADFGQGRVVGAKEAVDRGMADRVAPFDQVLSELNAGSPGRPKSPPDDKTGRRAQRPSILRKRLELMKK